MKEIGSLKLFTVEELSKTLGVQPRTIRELLKSGKLKGRKLARRWYVTEASLKEYFEDGQEGESGHVQGTLTWEEIVGKQA